MDFQSTKPLIVAHRGSSAKAPENTVAAFKLALEEGADGVEFDVRLSSDGVPVVFHDADLKRISNRSEAVSDLTAAMLNSVDAGSWFNVKKPDLANPQFENETIPALSTVLDLFYGFNGPVYVELKCTSQDMHQLGTAVGKVLKNYSDSLHLIVKSFMQESVPFVLQECPGLETAALYSEHIKLIVKDESRLIEMTRTAKADRLSVHTSLISEALMEAANHDGLPITVWTADSTSWVEKSVRLGIDTLITNKPASLLDARSKED